MQYGQRMLKQTSGLFFVVWYMICKEIKDGFDGKEVDPSMEVGWKISRSVVIKFDEKNVVYQSGNVKRLQLLPAICHSSSQEYVKNPAQVLSAIPYWVIWDSPPQWLWLEARGGF